MSLVSFLSTRLQKQTKCFIWSFLAEQGPTFRLFEIGMSFNAKHGREEIYCENPLLDVSIE